MKGLVAAMIAQGCVVTAYFIGRSEVGTPVWWHVLAYFGFAIPLSISAHIWKEIGNERQ